MSKRTEKNQIDDEHRGSERVFRSIFESLSDAVFIIDLYGKFIDVNKTALEQLGYTKAELLSMDVFELSTKGFAVRIPECISAVKECGQAVYEMAIKKKDGTVMPVEANCRMIDFGSEKIMLSVMRDVTERRRTEEALRKSQHFLSSILDGIGDGVVVIDRDYKIITANNGYIKQLKADPAEIVGMHCYNVSHHIDKPCFQAGEECSVKNAFETGVSHRIIHCHFDTDKNPIYVETVSYPLRDSAGKIDSVVEVVTDVTARMKVEEKLELKIKELEKFYEMSIDRELKMVELKNEIDRLKAAQ